MTTRESWFASHVRELRPEECLELIESRQVGRVGFNDFSGPVILPVNYALAEGCVLLATSAFGSLAWHAVGASVAFQVDAIDEFTESGWSVLIRGRASVVSDQELTDVDDRPRPWAEGTRALVLKISPVEVTGRRLIPA